MLQGHTREQGRISIVILPDFQMVFLPSWFSRSF